MEVADSRSFQTAAFPQSESTARLVFFPHNPGEGEDESCYRSQPLHKVLIIKVPGDMWGMIMSLIQEGQRIFLLPTGPTGREWRHVPG